MTQKIAIIGAGLAGLTLARELSDYAEVTVFEKARGVGGRMSTRYAEPFYFDHGAQFFTARDELFRSFVHRHIDSGDIAEWKGKIMSFEKGKSPNKSMWFEPHYVATPNMNSLCKTLSSDLSLVVNTEIAPLTAKQENGWHVTDKNGAALGCFDWVISTAPPAQTARLFGEHMAANALVREVTLLGCYTLMIGFKKPWDKQWIAATIRNHPLQWLAANSTKPGRDPNVTCLVAHSSHEWAEAHMDDDMAAAQAFLFEQLQDVTGLDISPCDYLSSHRWRYANLSERQSLEPYFDVQSKLASVGDWCAASRIEDVWLASHKLASWVRTA
jgi:predicted NAD/FAD-dependent oxidoreductase